MFDTFFWVSSQLSESGPIYICYFCTINPYIFDLGTTSDIFLGELSLSTDFTIKFCQNSDWISPLATSPKCTAPGTKLSSTHCLLAKQVSCSGQPKGRVGWGKTNSFKSNLFPSVVDDVKSTLGCPAHLPSSYCRLPRCLPPPCPWPRRSAGRRGAPHPSSPGSPPPSQWPLTLRRVASGLGACRPTLISGKKPPDRPSGDGG